MEIHSTCILYSILDMYLIYHTRTVYRFRLWAENLSDSTRAPATASQTANIGSGRQVSSARHTPLYNELDAVCIFWKHILVWNLTVLIHYEARLTLLLPSILDLLSFYISNGYFHLCHMKSVTWKHSHVQYAFDNTIFLLISLWNEHSRVAFCPALIMWRSLSERADLLDQPLKVFFDVAKPYWL